MQTFYIDKNDVNDNRLTVKGDVCHHISRVLRMRAGDSLRFSDNENHYYEGVIAEITKDYLTVNIERISSIDDEPHLSVTLIQCLPRGDKMDQILQKATELGVKRVIPVESENSQIRLKNKKAEKKSRWQKITASAAEQCGRGKIPVVEMPCALGEALKQCEGNAILFCYEEEENTSFRKTAERMKSETSEIALVIGPEGGFSPAEAEMIVAAGGRSVTMGRRILRTETAGPTALAVLMYEFGEWEAAE